MKIVNLRQRTAEWAKWRRQGITATAASVILKENPYMTPYALWRVITGRDEPKDLSRNPVVQRGVALEDVARKHIEDKFGVMLLPFCAEWDKNPLFRASFDGVDDSEVTHEIKVSSEKRFAEVKAEGRESETFKLYYPQVQHQLLVAGQPKGWLHFYTDSGEDGAPECLSFEIERDEVMIQRILNEGAAFWDLVQKDKAPEFDPDRDVYKPVEEGNAAWEAKADQWYRLREQEEQVKASLKELEADRRKLEKELQSMMGEYSLAEGGGVRISVYMQQGSVDYKKLVADRLPHLSKEDEDQYRRSPSQRVRVTPMETEEPAAEASEQVQNTDLALADVSGADFYL